MKEIACDVLFEKGHTIAEKIFEGVTYPYEVLPKISEFILELGKTLPADKFECREDNIWIAKSASVAPSAYIHGPAIIDEEAEIRHCAFIRGNAIVGKGAVVGNSTELKNVILFDKVQVPHYNYVGDSILGYHVHLGAGVILSNLKNDGTNIDIKYKGKKLPTGMRKMGSVIGDSTEVGCNSVLYPGTIIGKNTNIYPLTRVRGIINSNSIVKDENTVVDKEVNYDK